MAKPLVIVESPAKARTIEGFLGGEFTVLASMGHIRDLPAKGLSVDVDDDFKVVYEVHASKKETIARLRKALKDADQLYLATDEDREGEAISWHLLEVLKPTVPVKRMVFHEITQAAIQHAIDESRDVDHGLVDAQESRRIVDRLYGYPVSEVCWRKIRQGLSAGRVQSPSVRLVVERERERMAFVAAGYWDLAAAFPTEPAFTAALATIDGSRVAGSRDFDSTGRTKREDVAVLDETAAHDLRTRLDGQPFTVATVETKPYTSRPKPPFITSTLQQEGNRKLRFTSRQTMRVAQQLYEGIDLGGERTGLITYMRTDSLTLAGRAVAQARRVIADVYGQRYLPEKPNRYRTKSKGAQEAHEAIRPTDLSRRPQDVRRWLDADQYRLYELVWKRTIACQMLPARFERTSVEIEADAPAATGDGDGPAPGRAAERATFAANGRRIVFPGFLRAYVEGSDDPEEALGDKETLLPELAVGGAVEPREVAAEGHETKPPYRFTEASLVKKLEEAGIGRPSTYASILSTIQDRGYVFKRGNELVPTFTAFCVTQLLEQQFRDLVDTDFTAHMEDDLDEVAAGHKAWDELVAEFFHGAGGRHGLRQRVEEGEVTYPAVRLGADPETGEPLEVKVGKYGPYVRRGEDGPIASLPEDLPPADLTPDLAAEMLRGKEEDAEPIAVDEATGLPIHLRHGRFGFYLERELTAEEAAASGSDKPRRVSLPGSLAAESLDGATARRLMLLPRTVGTDPASGEEVTTGIGRYGPYVKRGDEFRSLGSWEEAVDVPLDRALEILARPKPGRRRGGTKAVLKELGEAAGAAGPLQVLDGRYGPYVTDGETNASLPRGADPRAVTVEEALRLLEARRNAPQRPRRRRRAKASKG